MSDGAGLVACWYRYIDYTPFASAAYVGSLWFCCPLALLLTPMLTTLPLQLLAYHIALRRGRRPAAQIGEVGYGGVR